MMNDAELVWQREDSGFLFSLVASQETVPVTKWGLYRPIHCYGRGCVTSLLAAVEQDTAALKTGHQVFCNDAYIASLTEVEILQLGLPPSSQCRLKLASQGLISKPGFTISHKLLRPDGLPFMGAKRDGVVLEAGSQQSLILDPIYSLLNRIEAFNAAQATDMDTRFVHWGEVQELLPEDAIVEGQLGNITICRADRITLDVKSTGRFEPVLIKPDLDKDLDIQGQSDVATAIPPAKQREFERQFSNRADVRSNYAIGGGTYIVLPARVVNVLKVVRKYQQEAPEKRHAFIANPSQFINDALVDAGIANEELESLFVETPEFISQRIECIGVWEPKICAYRAERNGDWVPEDAERVQLPIGDQLVQLSVDDAKDLLVQVITALDQEQPDLVWNGLKLPVNFEVKNILIRFLKPYLEAKEEHPSSNVLAPLLKDNIEDVEYNNLTHFKPRSSLDSDVELLKTKPLYPHQDAGLEWLVEHWISGSPGALLADDMGLGKTIQCLAFMSLLQQAMVKETIPKKPFLIVAPSGLLKNWIDEEAKHLLRPGLGELFEAYGERLRHFEKLTSLERIHKVGQAGWVLTTYETLRDKIRYFISVDWAGVYFDEAQKIKNPTSRTTEMAKSLSSDFTLIVTGTPVENELKDLWCLVDTARPGLFGSLREFHNAYVKAAEADPVAAQALTDVLVTQTIPSVMLRRMKQDHLQGLPEKYQHDMPVEMPKLQAEEYENIIKDAQLTRGVAGGVLQIIQQMRKASLIAEELDEEGITDHVIARSARLSALVELVDQIAAKQEKVLVFVEFLEIQEHLSTYLQQRYQLPKRPMTINGKINGVTRKKYVDVFQTTRLNEFDVMLLSPKAGGVGLTLTEANHVIHLTRWWNPAVEDQSTDRVFRIGQERDVHVYYPMAIHPRYKSKSFDMNLNRLLNKKRDLSVNALMSGAASRSDIQALFEESLIEENMIKV